MPHFDLKLPRMSRRSFARRALRYTQVLFVLPPDLLQFSAFFVTGDNFVFQDESFGAVSAILNSDNETMWIAAILLTGLLIWASATK